MGHLGSYEDFTSTVTQLQPKISLTKVLLNPDRYKIEMNNTLLCIFFEK